MACSKHKTELGYEENRFEIVVSQNFHCPICFLVLRDPVMCQNQHVFCNSCINKHLENSATCPTCVQPLSVDTLNRAPNIVTDYISELNIHCDFYSRGCPEMVQVAKLERHVANCRFSPVQCSNEGCEAVVNVKDKLRHEEEECEFRQVKCHGCGDRGSLLNDLLLQMLSRQEEIKREIKAEMQNEMKKATEQIKVEVKREIKEVTSEMKAMKNELKQDTQATKNRIKVEVKSGTEALKNEMKQEISGIKSGMTSMKSELKNELGALKNGVKEMKGMKEEIKVEVKGEMGKTKEEIAKKIKEGINKVDGGLRAMKNEIKQDTKGIKTGQKEMKNEMNEMKEEITRNVTHELKVEMMEGINAMKEEMKIEIKEIVMNAIQTVMGEGNDLVAAQEDEPSYEDESSYEDEYGDFYID